MKQEKIDRINELARRSRIRNLSEEELVEQKQLRQEYIESIKTNFIKSIESIKIIDEYGNSREVRKKK